MRDLVSKEHWVTMRRCWPWLAIAGVGLVAHAGTALLRLSTFFPSPKLFDFSGFYASAWALRLGFSPYYLPLEFLQLLQTQQAIPFTPPVIFNPPFWPWLLQPLTRFSFPVAASLWLVLNLVLLAWATVALADMAGYRSWRARVPFFFLVLTFGPVFLDLTLGQTSAVLLVASLAIGRSLSRYRPAGIGNPLANPANSARRTNGRSGAVSTLVVALAGALAVGVKLFPLTWLGALPFLRRWGAFALAALLIVAILGWGFIVSPASSQEYGKYLLTERLVNSSEVTSVDDQALIAWLDRLARPQTFAVSGFGVEQRTTVVWSPPWVVDARVVRWVGYALLALLLVLCLFVLLRAAPERHEAAFYLWVLYGLIALLHIERYNHVLLLPAMAWLWGHSLAEGDGRGRGQRIVVVVAYALVGLSRLTHLWAILLPAPWGPLASGFGMYAVFLLGAAIVVNVWPSNWVNAVETGRGTRAQG
jgi:hypothetical protein